MVLEAEFRGRAATISAHSHVFDYDISYRSDGVVRDWITRELMHSLSNEYFCRRENP
jgi:hypothetical protein